MLHSGSRNVGKVVADIAISKAKEMVLKEGISLENQDLAWLSEGTKDFNEYIDALNWCQSYAYLNRKTMFYLVKLALSNTLNREITLKETAVNCHHNYTNLETHFGEQMWITRKGAVSAKLGEYGIIPGSMGTKSYIVRGKGNPDSYHSCSHGAGRKMSRNEAKKTFTQEDFIQQTLGVECRKDKEVIDEIPGAYKSIDDVIEAQHDLVEIVRTLKQVLCVKG